MVVGADAVINPMLFNATATLQVKTATADAMGGQGETWAAVAAFTAKPVMLKSIMAERRPMDEKNTFIYTHKIYCPNYAAISEHTHRLAVGSIVYEIMSSEYIDEHWEVTTRATA